MKTVVLLERVLDRPTRPPLMIRNQSHEQSARNTANYWKGWVPPISDKNLFHQSKMKMKRDETFWNETDKVSEDTFVLKGKHNKKKGIVGN
jgi:hypothetical protein